MCHTVSLIQFANYQQILQLKCFHCIEVHDYRLIELNRQTKQSRQNRINVKLQSTSKPTKNSYSTNFSESNIFVWWPQAFRCQWPVASYSCWQICECVAGICMVLGIAECGPFLATLSPEAQNDSTNKETPRNSRRI